MVNDDDVIRLHGRIDELDRKISDKLDTLHAAQAKSTGVCRGCQEKIGQHHRELYGNGRAGLVSEVVSQRERLDQLRDPERTAKRAGNTSIASIVVAIASAIATALTAWFK